MIDYAFILNEKYEGCKWQLEGDEYEGLVWLDVNHPKPSKQELDDAYLAFKKANDYKFKRAKLYPKIADQLDALWHAMDAGVLPMVADFYDPIKAVKDANPKPAV